MLMKIHRRLHPLVFGAMLLLFSVPVSADVSWYSYFDGKKYVSTLSREDIKEMKPWDMKGNQALPVTPKEVY